MKKSLHKREKGNIGENIACKFLKTHDFSIICRNFQRKWGELDIIAEKDKLLHFFEVKSVLLPHSLGQNDNFGLKNGRTLDIHKPEDNVDGWKVKHLRRIIETYLEVSKRGLNSEFQFHVLTVYMDFERRIARVNWLQNIIL